MPERIQMSRQRPWRHEHPDAVIVARPSKWGNPVRVEGTDHERAVRAFRMIVVHPPSAAAHGYPSREQIKTELTGRDLACWCPLDSACHADVLLELANRPPDG